MLFPFVAHKHCCVNISETSQTGQSCGVHVQLLCCFWKSEARQVHCRSCYLLVTLTRVAPKGRSVHECYDILYIWFISPVLVDLSPCYRNASAGGLKNRIA